mmetsp:Transcript_96425/g.167483  ORF Transcript_96425/g.167483 Transcript_96425/m.167483 type:complete len:212 (-) Transcript_96425:130-765(-)
MELYLFHPRRESTDDFVKHGTSPFRGCPCIVQKLPMAPLDKVLQATKRWQLGNLEQLLASGLRRASRMSLELRLASPLCQLVAASAAYNGACSEARQEERGEADEATNAHTCHANARSKSAEHAPLELISPLQMIFKIIFKLRLQVLRCDEAINLRARVRAVGHCGQERRVPGRGLHGAAHLARRRLRCLAFVARTVYSTAMAGRAGHLSI